MEASLFIARLMGPILIVSAIGLLLNQDRYKNMVLEFEKNAVILFMTGVMALLLGLILVEIHNIWSADWRVIITAFGWISLVAGIVRIVFPTLVIKIARNFMDNPTLLFGAIAFHLILGGWLSYVGYLG